MKLTIADFKTERQWRAATGVDRARFEQLLGVFSHSYRERYGQSVGQRQADIEVAASLRTEEELLLFTLFSLKAGLTYDLLGVVCGMDAANAKRNQTLGLGVLETALSHAGCLPKREFKDAAEFAAYLKHQPLLIVDGMEQHTQRPQEEAAQKDNYSGKKKRTRSKR